MHLDVLLERFTDMFMEWYSTGYLIELKYIWDMEIKVLVYQKIL